MVEDRDPTLCGFFNVLFQSTNPTSKNFQTQQQLKKKIVILCYQLAGLRNKHVSGVKEATGLFLIGAGTSVIGINALNNAGLTVNYQTIWRSFSKTLNQHEENLKSYFYENVNM